MSDSKGTKAKDSTILNISASSSAIPKRKRNQIPDAALSTPVFPQPINALTLNGNNPICKKRSRRTNSSPTSGVASTSNAKALQPFWTQSSAVWSQRLWSCTETDCRVLEPTFWSPSLRALAQNSWFTVRQTVRRMTPVSLPMTCSQSPRSLWRVITEGDQPTIAVEDPKKAKEPVKPPPVGMHKVRIYPTTEQKATIKSWIGAARWTYNRVVAYLNDPETKDHRTIKDLRTHSVNNEMITKTKKNWIGSIPYDVRDEGLRDAHKAVGSNLAKQRIRKKKGLSHSFKMKYRYKKRAHQESVVLHSKHWCKGAGVYFDLLGSSGAKLKSSEPLPIILTYDIRLFRTRLDEYFLCIPQTPKIHDDSQVPDAEGSSTVALDPGVRTFMTAYDASGCVVEWGVGDTTRIYRLCHTLDKLHESWKDVNHRKRYKLQRAALKIRRKIRRLVDELHRKLIQWLCNNFRVVLIPTFETQKMVRRGHRRLNSKTAKMMCTWSHFRFRTNLTSKAKTFPCTRVIETTEEFTSKTCGMCGMINHKLGGKKTFTCPSHTCGFRSDRDFNGARNILIRHLTVTRAGQ